MNFIVVVFLLHTCQAEVILILFDMLSKNCHLTALWQCNLLCTSNLLVPQYLYLNENGPHLPNSANSIKCNIQKCQTNFQTIMEKYQVTSNHLYFSGPAQVSLKPTGFKFTPKKNPTCVWSSYFIPSMIKTNLNLTLNSAKKMISRL